MKHEISNSYDIDLNSGQEFQEPTVEEINLESVLNKFWNDAIRGLMVCCPARVVGVQFVEEYRIDVQPLIEKEWGDEVVESYPTISNVPYIGVGTDDCGVLFSPKQNQTVLLIFSQASLDEFKGGSISPYNPLSKRVMDMDDAIAIPSLFPFNRSPNRKIRHYTDHSTDDVTIVNNLGTKKENKLIVKKGGKIEIRSPNEVQINAPNSVFDGNLKVAGDATFQKNVKVLGTLDVVEDIFIAGRSLLTYMDKHVHSGVQGGNSNTAPALPIG